MRNGWKRFLSLVLCVALVWGILPAQLVGDLVKKALAIEPPLGPHDGLILEFASGAKLYEFLRSHEGENLGGNLLLVDGGFEDAEVYEKMEGITSVTYNYTFEAAEYDATYEVAPDDTYFEDQLYPADTQVWHTLANKASSFENFAYTTIRVGVVDTGIDGTHEDLASRVVAGYDAVADAEIEAGVNSDVSYTSHGTKVAGLIAAEAYNAKGIAGTAGKFPVELVPIRALDQDNEGKLADVVKAIYWAIDHDIDILNMSFGARLSYYPVALGKAIQAALDAGIWINAAAGNEGDKTYEGFYPAGIEGVYAVVSSANYEGDTKASYSNEPIYTGTGYTGRIYAGCCGTDLLTTAVGNSYEPFTGTSASCAVITGYIAAINTVTGGRNNPLAYSDIKYMMYVAHYENYYGMLDYYGISDSYLQYGISDNLTEELLHLNENKIRAIVEAPEILSGTVEVSAFVSSGLDKVVKAELIVTTENETYTSPAIFNDGSNPDRYTFTLDTTAFSDGEAQLQIILYAPDDGMYVYNAYCFRDVWIQNSLVSDYATIRVFNEDGDEIRTNVTVSDPATGKVVAELTYNNSTGEADNRIHRSLFGGGQLTFSVIGTGMLYSVTTGFTQEILLGDTVQATDLLFTNGTVTLANAPVYAITATGQTPIGTTDANGKLTVSMTDATFELAVVDNVNRYYLTATATQDGNQLELSFADAISGAQVFTVAAADRLSQYDYYTVGLSKTQVKTLADHAVIAWIPATENTLHITPGQYYMMIGIHDTMFEEGAQDAVGEHRYVDIIHVLGLVDTTVTTSVDFDPTILKATLIPDRQQVDYGESVHMQLSLTDDMGYPLIGGDSYGYDQFGHISDVDRWNQGYNLEAYNSAEEWMFGCFDYDTTRGQFYTYNNYEPLPFQEDYYRITLSYYFYDEFDSYTDALAYTSQNAETTVHVVLGNGIEVKLATPAGFESMHLERISAMVNGEPKELLIFDYTSDVDLSITYNISASGLSEGAPLLLELYAYDGEKEYYFYQLAEYAAGQAIAVQMPQQFGQYVLFCQGEPVEQTLIRIPAGDGWFLYDLPSAIWGNPYVPAGQYTIMGMGYAGSDPDTWMARFLAYAVDVTVRQDTLTEVEMSDMATDQILVRQDRAWDSIVHYSVIIGGEVIDLNSRIYDDEFYLLRHEGVEAVQLSYVAAELEYDGEEETGDGLRYTGIVDFGMDLLYLDNHSISHFFAEAPQELTPEDEVFISLDAIVMDGLKLTQMEHVSVKKHFLDEDRMNYDLEMDIHKAYSVTARYRMVGGDWVDVPNVDWYGAKLGKLAAGSYEIEFFLEADASVGLAEQYAYCAFTVGQGVQQHMVEISGPESTTGTMELLIKGNPGASVTIYSVDPDGYEGEAASVTIPSAGFTKVMLELDRDGIWQFYAVSTRTVSGETETLTSETISIDCDRQIPLAITGFRVTSQGDASLLLQWEPTDAARIWIYRDGENLGFVPAGTTQYLDSNLSEERIYTYYIIPESEAGVRGEAVFASARPSVQPDTTAPTAPAQLRAEGDGMRTHLSWTRGNDDGRVSLYRVYRDGQLIAELPNRSYTDEGLYKSTTYTYTVTAVDSSGNESPASPAASVTTPDHYSLERFTATMDVNRQGTITGSELVLFADAGRAADRVWAQIVFIHKSQPGVEQTVEMDLASFGKYWKTTYDLEGISKVISVTGFASEGDEQYNSLAADGFPAAVQSMIRFDLTVYNAFFAPKALQNMKIVLSEQGGQTWVLPVETEWDTVSYVFDRLSPGNYLVSVLYEGNSLHLSDPIILGEGDVQVAQAEIDSFIRIQMASKLHLFTLPGESYSLTDDGYLALGEDSAFFMPESFTLMRNCSQYVAKGEQLFKIPEAYAVELVDGVTIYTVPDLESFETVEAHKYTVHVTTPYSNTDITGLVLRTTSAVAVVDKDGYATFLLPYSNRQTITLERAELTDDEGNILAVFPDQEVIAAEDTITEFPLREEQIREVTLTLQGMENPEGVTGTLYVADKRYSLTFPADGVIVMPVTWDFTGMRVVLDAGMYGMEYICRASFSSEETSLVMQITPQKVVEKYFSIRILNDLDFSTAGLVVTIHSKLATETRTLNANGQTYGSILALEDEEEFYVNMNSTETEEFYWDALKAKGPYGTSELDNPQVVLKATASRKFHLKTASPGQNYFAFYYDAADLSAPVHTDVIWQQEFSIHPKDFPESGMIAVLLPKGKDILLNESLSYDTVAGFDAAVVIRIEDLRQAQTIEMPLVHTISLGDFTDLQDRNISYRVCLYHVVDGTLLRYIRGNWGDWILWDYDDELVVALPEYADDALYSKYLPHMGTLADSFLLNTQSEPMSFRFGFQRQYSFQLIRSDGPVHEHAGSFFACFSEFLRQDKGEGNSFNNFTFYIESPLQPHQVYATWTLGEMNDAITDMLPYWTDLHTAGDAVLYELDPTVRQDETIVLELNGEYQIRISRIFGELNVKTDSITKTEEGDLLVRLTLSGASRYQSFVKLPAGAREVLVDDVAVDREFTLEQGSTHHSVSFRISAEELEQDNQVWLYVISPTGSRILQFVVPIEDDVFVFEYRPWISSNQVTLNERYFSNFPTSVSKTRIADVSVLSYPFGAYFGEIGKAPMVSMSVSGGGSASDRGFRHVAAVAPIYTEPKFTNDIDEDMTLEEYLRYGYSFDCGKYTLYGRDGAWIMFESHTDDFAISITVDGQDLDYTIPEWLGDLIGSTQNVGDVGGGWDNVDGENHYYNSSDILARYQMYDPNTGMGALFIPFGTEPDRYPAVYDIELRFKYRDDNGQIQVNVYDEESITMYYQAPVLKNWYFEHYGRAGKETSPVYYEAIQSYEERVAFEKEMDKARHLMMDWNGTDIFTFYAYFDKPEEVCDVYAVAVVDSDCENYALPLHYDEELGCYVGTGRLGDAVNPPSDFSIVYDYVGRQTHNDMPTVQLQELHKNYENSLEEPKPENVQYMAPDNGWTLEYTNEMWRLYYELTADAYLSEDDIARITDDDGKLYAPKLAFYDENGELLGYRQDYIDFEPDAESEDAYHIAVMNGTDYVATIADSVTIIDEHNILFRTRSTDPSLLLPCPHLYDEDFQMPGSYGTASTKLPVQPLSGGILEMTPFAIPIGLKPKVGAPVGVAYEVGSNVSNVVSMGTFMDAVMDDVNFARDYASDLTPAQMKEYYSFQRKNYLGMAAETLLGCLGPVGSFISSMTGLGHGAWYQERMEYFRKLARDNRNEGLNGGNPWTMGLSPTDLASMLQYHIDPSGYIFEGHEENRLSGVTATVYYQDPDGNWVKWDSEAYDEGPNPNISDDEGRYGWDVLIGKWKVIFEKDGYFIAESQELDVPPPHMDVNIGMVSMDAAVLTGVLAGPQGAYVDFTFDRPVLVEDVQKLAAIYFGGYAQPGTIEALDAGLTSNGNKQASSDHDLVAGMLVARTFRFTPEEAFEVGASVCVRVAQGVLTYNGMECQAFESEYVQVPEAVDAPITAISYNASHILQIGESLDLKTDLEVKGTDGTIVWTALNPEIATITADGVVTAVSGGVAIFMATCGDVVGMASVVVEAPTHVCVFDQKNLLGRYLCYESEDGDVYYYSCACGECGHETWVYQEYVAGDVNGDGKVNARDARLLLRFVAGLTEDGEVIEAAADFNGDGKINCRDARAILQFVAGLDT